MTTPNLKHLLTCLALGLAVAACRQGKETKQLEPVPEVTLASFRGTILGQEIVITEDLSDPTSFDATVGVRLLPGQTVPEYANLSVFIRPKSGRAISFDVPSIPFREYSFATIQQVFAVGSKRFNEKIADEDRFGNNYKMRFREGFDFVFSGISTIGDQTGSNLEVTSLREIAPPPNSGVLRALEVSLKMDAKLYADSNQPPYGEVKNAELTLKFYYYGPPKVD
jgi:hypothetical protein